MATRAPQREIAYHEVGHVVVATVLGKRFDLISIVPDSGGSGYVKFPPCEPEPKRDLAIAVAGPIAIKMAAWGGPPEILMLYFPWELDLDQALDAIDSLAPDDKDVPRQFNLGVLRAIEILDRSWDAVDPLVDELLEHRELGWSDVKPMMDDMLNGEAMLKLDELKAGFILDGRDGILVGVLPSGIGASDSDEVLITYGSEL